MGQAPGSPALYVENIGDVAVRDFEVRYYFTAEQGRTPLLDVYFHHQSTVNLVRVAGDNYYVSIKYIRYLNPGEKTDWGTGTQFALHYQGWLGVWDRTNDWSGEGMGASFSALSKVVVLDHEGKIIHGSEPSGGGGGGPTPPAESGQARVVGKDGSYGDQHSSQPIFYIENTGQVPLQGLESRYYFAVPSNMTPVLDVYSHPQSNVDLVNLGNGRYYVRNRYTVSLAPGEKTEWGQGVQFALHFTGWQSGWVASDDPSWNGMSSTYSQLNHIPVFDETGRLLTGSVPAGF